MGNVLHVNAERGIVKSDPLFQFDYGQKLVIEGLELPDTYEVHFADGPDSHTSITQIGNSEGVGIPDMLLTKAGWIFAWLYLHVGPDDGETVFVIKIPVKERSGITNTVPTPIQQDEITEVIAALNAAVAKSETNVEHYPKILDGYWYTWDAETESFVNTGSPATGPKGETGAQGPQGIPGDPTELIDDGSVSATKTWSSGRIDTTKANSYNPTFTGDMSVGGKITVGGAPVNNNDVVRKVDLDSNFLANLQSIAPTYDETATYALDDYVFYKTRLYRCITAIETAEAWDATHWTETTVMAEIKRLLNS